MLDTVTRRRALQLGLGAAGVYIAGCGGSSDTAPEVSRPPCPRTRGRGQADHRQLGRLPEPRQPRAVRPRHRRQGRQVRLRLRGGAARQARRRRVALRHRGAGQRRPPDADGARRRDGAQPRPAPEPAQPQARLRRPGLRPGQPLQRPQGLRDHQLLVARGGRQGGSAHDGRGLRAALHPQGRER